MPTVQFSLAAFEVEENGGQATIQVTLSTPSSEPVMVDFRTGDGTAMAGEDYAMIATDTCFRC